MPIHTPPKNRALWLTSFDKPLETIELPVPEATPGSAVVEVLATLILPYSRQIHNGTLQNVYHLQLPLVPNATSIARVYAAGPDAVRSKEGDLVYVDATINGRDSPDVFIMQGHHGGEDPIARQKLMQGQWRDGALQNYQRVPLENCYPLDESRLFQELGYTAADLEGIAIYSVAAGALYETANLRAGETVIIGPAGGSFGGAAVEMALALGANVVALGRSEEKLSEMAKHLGAPMRFKYVVMTGKQDADTAAIRRACPGGGYAQVYNDWTPAGMIEPPYMGAAVRALASGAKVVLSGGGAGSAPIPYGYAVNKSLTIHGKAMCSRATLEWLIGLISADILRIGKRGGAAVQSFGLDDLDDAEQHAAKYGGWRNQTVVEPRRGL